MRKNKYIILDVEPVGGLACPLCWNIAWRIIDKKGLTYVERSYIVSEIFEQTVLFSTTFNKNKKPLVENIQHEKLWKVLKQLKDDYFQHSVEAIVSYNSSFDMRALLKTCIYVGVENPLKGLTFWDLRQMAKVLTRQKMYSKKSEKMRDVYSYSVKTDYKQTHIAHEDVEAEVKIFANIMRQKKAMLKGENQM